MAEYPKDCGAGEDMKVDGNVGIGTASPEKKLDIVDTGLNALKFQRSGYSDVILGITNLGGTGGHALAIKAKNYDFRDEAGNNMVCIDDGGNVGIGTTSPASKLDVDGGDVRIRDKGAGIILTSPNGAITRRLLLKNDGTLGFESP